MLLFPPLSISYNISCPGVRTNLGTGFGAEPEDFWKYVVKKKEGKFDMNLIPSVVSNIAIIAEIHQVLQVHIPTRLTHII